VFFRERVIETWSEQETEALGQTLASELGSGDILALYGELGAGKTCLVRGLTLALSAAELATSPTFTLLHEYEGKIPVYHFDLYRLRTVRELEDIGCEEYFYGDGICVLEWPEKAEAVLPQAHWKIFMEIQAEKKRRIKILSPISKS
jgi:tRNA threonylcarbamoyladenosine biosynthesis protein TsaE